jgi:DNA-binding HxlR family transcriptional regulator
MLLCKLASGNTAAGSMTAKLEKRTRKPKRRSECPLNASVEMLGDRWSLLIIRDMMLRGFRAYKQFMECYEGIATNILADRLRKLVANGIITTEPDPSDGRKLIYLLTKKGIDLAPVLAEMVLWAAAHEQTGNQSLVRQMRAGKERVIAEARQRWATQTGNATPSPAAHGRTKFRSV